MKVIFCTWLIILNWVTHFGFYPSNPLSRYWILILLLIKSEGFDPCRCLKCYINGSTISISLQFPVRISFQIKDQLVIYSHMAWLNCCGKQILLWPDSWLFKCRADPPALSIIHSFPSERNPWHRHALWFYAFWVLHARSRELRPLSDAQHKFKRLTSQLVASASSSCS